MFEVDDGGHEQKPNSRSGEQCSISIGFLDATINPSRKFLAMLDKYDTFKTVLKTGASILVSLESGFRVSAFGYVDAK